MRISTSVLYERGVSNIQQKTANLSKFQQIISTQRRVLSPSDDPIASARALEVSQSEGRNTQFLKNTQAAKESLVATENTLTSVTSSIQDIQQIAVHSGNGALTSSEKEMMATELEGIYKQMLGLANSTDNNGLYLFSGYQGQTKPFDETSPGVVQYYGDQGQRQIQISDSRRIPVSDAGIDIFMRIKNGNGTFVTSAGTNPASVPANSINLGTGVISSGRVVDPNLWNAAANPKDFTIRFAVDNAVTPPVTTYDIVDNVSGNSLLTGAAAVIGGPYARVYQDGATISLKNQGAEPAFDFGADLAVDGAPVDGDTFNVDASTNVDLFTTINNLVTNLRSNTVTANQRSQYSNNLNTALNGLNNALDKVLTTRASVGARLQESDSVDSVGQDLAVQYKETLSNLLDVDYAQAVTDLTKEQTFLEAAQKSFQRVQGLSLFNYL